ncbi:MAG TPA: hypothetical protein VGS23_01785 [Thermoplasmata archaeon]|nr:hypothetical protein [Thermoplasmata archaeon]
MRCTTGKRSGSSSGGRSPRGTALVLLDTNALFLPFTSPLRLEAAVERAVGPARLVVPISVLGELHRLAERGVPNAGAAFEMAVRFPLAATDRRGDEGVRESARRLKASVATSDRALRDRLLHDGVRVLFPRGRAGLVAVPPRPPQTVKVLRLPPFPSRNRGKPSQPRKRSKRVRK